MGKIRLNVFFLFENIEIYSKTILEIYIFILYMSSFLSLQSYTFPSLLTLYFVFVHNYI
jgi:hypothetical protein